MHRFLPRLHLEHLHTAEAFVIQLDAVVLGIHEAFLLTPHPAGDGPGDGHHDYNDDDSGETARAKLKPQKVKSQTNLHKGVPCGMKVCHQ